MRLGYDCHFRTHCSLRCRYCVVVVAAAIVVVVVVVAVVVVGVVLVVDVVVAHDLPIIAIAIGR